MTREEKLARQKAEKEAREKARADSFQAVKTQKSKTQAAVTAATSSLDAVLPEYEKHKANRSDQVQKNRVVTGLNDVREKISKAQHEQDQLAKVRTKYKGKKKPLMLAVVASVVILALVGGLIGFLLLNNKPKEYTVTFVVDNEVFVSNSDIYHTSTVKKDDKVTPPTEPEIRQEIIDLHDYIFVGWFIDQFRTELYDFAQSITADLTLYAGYGYEIEITITIDGVPTTTTISIIRDRALDKEKLSELMQAEAPEGQIFIGLFEDEDLDEPFDLESLIDGNMILHAGFGYEVFLSLEGEEVVNFENVVAGKLLRNVLPSPAPPADKYFVGWFEDEGFTIPFNHTEPITRTTTIFGEFAPYVLFTITWINGSDIESEQLNDGAIPTPLIIEPTKESLEPDVYVYVFIGWSADQFASPGDAGIVQHDGPFPALSSDTTYYAIFDINVLVQYYITIDDGFGGVSVVEIFDSTDDYTFEDLTSQAQNITGYELYEFLGWLIDNGGTRICPITAHTADLSGLILAGTTLTVATDAIYYAIWLAPAFTITWEWEDVSGITQTHIETGYLGYEFPQPPAAVGNYTSNHNDYTFDGWSVGLPDLVLNDITLIAIFSSSPVDYNITFKNGNNTIWDTTGNFNNSINYGGSAPTRDEDANYIYTFIGWTTDARAASSDWFGSAGLGDDFYASLTGVLVDGNMTFYAVFTRTSVFTVDFVDHDETRLVTALHQVMNGETTEFDGSEPSRVDNNHIYEFMGWSTENGIFDSAQGANGGLADFFAKDTAITVTGNMKLYAVYQIIGNKYTITYRHGSDTLGTEIVVGGQSPTFNGMDTPSDFDDDKYTYTFVGWNTQSQDFWTGDDLEDWSEEVIDGAYIVSGNATLYAIFSRQIKSFSVELRNHDGTLLNQQNVEYGGQPDYDAENPTRPDADIRYVFIGWSADGGTTLYASIDLLPGATANTVYTAVFEAEIAITYNNGSSFIDDEIIEPGQKPTYSVPNPSDFSDSRYNYTFIGWALGPQDFWNAFDGEPASWSESIITITTYTPSGHVTLYAVFSRTIIPYSMTWINGLNGGAEVDTKDDAVFGEAEHRTANFDDADYFYTFVGWTTSDNSDDWIDPTKIIPGSATGVTVSGNETLYAVYLREAKFYVTWKNDGAQLREDKHRLGESIEEYLGIPTRSADNTYSYEFVGWTTSTNPNDWVNPSTAINFNTIDAILENWTFYAVFRTTQLDYSVTFLTENGAFTINDYKFNAEINIPGDWANWYDADYDYIFIGWSTVEGSTVALPIPFYIDGIGFADRAITYYPVFERIALVPDFVFTITYSTDVTIGTGAITSGGPFTPAASGPVNKYYYLNPAWFAGIVCTDKAIIGVQVNGTGQIYYLGQTIVLTENTELTFVFGNPWRVTINWNGAGADENFVGENASISLVNNTENKQYHRFLGFATSNVAWNSGATLYRYQDIDNRTVSNFGEVTFYAIWEPVQIILMYDRTGAPNGAQGAHINVRYDELAYIAERGTLAWPGREFRGWSIHRDGSEILGTTQSMNSAFINTALGLSSNYTAGTIVVIYIYAIWEDSGSTEVLFNLSGVAGALIDFNTYIHDSGTLLYNGTGVTGVPSASSINHNFVGWGYFDGTDLVLIEGSGWWVPNSTVPVSERTLYAIWEITIIYRDAQDNTVIRTENARFGHGSHDVLRVNDRTHANLTRVTGWNTTRNGTGTAYSNGDAVSLLSGHTTLYATWMVTITFNGNGNTGGALPASQSYVYDFVTASNNTIYLSTNNLTRTGLDRIAGWNTAANGTGTAYADADASAITQNTTLYATWLVTITYNGNGHTGGTVPASVSWTLGNAGTKTLANQTLTRTGLTTHNSWHTTSITGTRLAGGANIAALTANTTYFAAWEVVITYDGNGHTSGTLPAVQRWFLNNAGTQTLANQNLTRTNLTTHNSWHNGSPTGTRFAGGTTDIAALTANRTYFAAWQIVITYNGNGHTSGTINTTELPIGGTRLQEWFLGAAAPTVLNHNLARTNLTRHASWHMGSITGTRVANGAAMPETVTQNTTFFAAWEVVVTYNGNGNTGGTVPAVQRWFLNNAGTTQTLATQNLTRTGLTTHNSWHSGSTTGARSAGGANIAALTANTTYFAAWEIVVTYNGNGHTGGTVPGNTTWFLNGTAPNATAVPTALARTGLTRHDSWHNGSTTGTRIAGGASMSAITTNTTLFAAWEVVVTYDGNGHTGGTVPAVQRWFLNNAGTQTLANQTLTRTGLTTTNQWHSRTVTGSRYPGGSTDISTRTENITYFAAWEVVITYNGNGNTGGTVPAVQRWLLNNAGTQTLANQTLTRTGLTTHNSWHITSTTGARSAGGANIATLTANTTYFAAWEVVVTYDGNGHTGGTVPAEQRWFLNNAGIQNVEWQILTRTGLTTDNSWHLGAANSTQRYSGGASLSLFTTSTTLFAAWRVEVTYHFNGATSGSATINAQSISFANGTHTISWILNNSGGQVVGSTNSLARPNLLNHNSWHINSPTSASRLDAGAGIAHYTTNMDLYAAWQIRVTYDRNGGGTTGTFPSDPSTWFLGQPAPNAQANSIQRAGLAATNQWHIGSSTATSLITSGTSMNSITENTTLFVAWEVVVRYFGNNSTSGTIGGVTGSNRTQTWVLGIGGAQAIFSNGLNRTNTTRVAGWNTSAVHGGTHYSDGANITNITASLDLYATWTVTIQAMAPGSANYLTPTTGMAGAFSAFATATTRYVGSTFTVPTHNITTSNHNLTQQYSQYSTNQLRTGALLFNAGANATVPAFNLQLFPVATINVRQWGGQEVQIPWDSQVYFLTSHSANELRFTSDNTTVAPRPESVATAIRVNRHISIHRPSQELITLYWRIAGTTDAWQTISG